MTNPIEALQVAVAVGSVQIAAGRQEEKDGSWRPPVNPAYAATEQAVILIWMAELNAHLGQSGEPQALLWVLVLIALAYMIHRWWRF